LSNDSNKTLQKVNKFREYSKRLLGIANRIRLLGNVFNDSRIVEKVLVTILEGFKTTITMLENTKDLSNITLA